MDTTITYLIMGITIGASFLAWNQPQLFSKLMMNPYNISHKNEYFRFISSGFIHKDHMHLLFNMFSFYFFGQAVEQIFKVIYAEKGGLYFMLMYLAAVALSDFPTYLKNRNNVSYNSLGASGAVSAVIMIYIIFQPLNLICIYIALCLPGFILGAAYIAYSYYKGRRANDNINHDAHLYGALLGLLFCLIFYPRSISIFFEQIRNWDLLEKIF